MNRLLAWLNDEGPDHPDWHLALRIVVVLAATTLIPAAVLIGALILDTTTTY